MPTSSACRRRSAGPTRDPSLRAADAPRLAEIIHRGPHEVNACDYPAEIIEKMGAHHTTGQLIILAGQRQVTVAESSSVVVGTA